MNKIQTYNYITLSVTFIALSLCLTAFSFLNAKAVVTSYILIASVFFLTLTLVLINFTSKKQQRITPPPSSIVKLCLSTEKLGHHLILHTSIQKRNNKPLQLSDCFILLSRHETNIFEEVNVLIPNKHYDKITDFGDGIKAIDSPDIKVIHLDYYTIEAIDNISSELTYSFPLSAVQTNDHSQFWDIRFFVFIQGSSRPFTSHTVVEANILDRVLG